MRIIGYLKRVGLGMAGTLLLFGISAGQKAAAVPSMARQTGMPCAACHTVFPELTPFGRQFKLGGFSLKVAKGAEATVFDDVPISALLQVSRTATKNTATDQATDEAFPRDRETIIQAAGVYYGGRIAENLGALVQYNYDGIERKWGMEMFDARYGADATIAGRSLAWGVTMNNGPTLSDLYASTPMWGFPHTQSATVMPAAATLVDMTLASQIGGVAAYGMVDQTLYVELGAYHTAKYGFFRFMGLGDPTETVVSGNAPYWRVSLQNENGPHSFHAGAYGMTAKVLADAEDQGLGSDRFRDVGLDAGYQYVGDEYLLSTHATWIHERQNWNASFDQGLSSLSSSKLDTFRADAHCFFQRKYGGVVQYFQTRGDTNDLRYNSGEPVMGSANGSPNSKGWITELDWLPMQNLKLGARYTAYQQFNGAKSNYDGFGRNAKDNNSVFLFAWLLL